MYRIEAERQGFKRLVRENVRVEVAGVSALDLTLEVGGVAETITVISAVIWVAMLAWTARRRRREYGCSVARETL
jgi:hypothetical protein